LYVRYFKKNLKISFANSSGFSTAFVSLATTSTSSGALVIVADKQKVYAYLLFAANRYLDLKTGEEIVNLKDKFSGKYQIWVQKTEQNES
jgi:hypothetical protein